MVKHAPFSLARCPFATVVLKCAALLAVAALPVRAQGDMPHLQLGIAYGNLKLPSGGITSARHTGIATQAAWNFTPWIGVENHLALYSIGGGSKLTVDIVSARISGRALSGKAVVPYGTFGYGGASVSQSNARYRKGSVPAGRIAGGLEFLVIRPLSVRVDVGRLWLRSSIAEAGLNGTIGAVFNFKY